MAAAMKQTELQLLVFTISGTRYGIDVEQIASLQNYDSAQVILKFHELVAAKAVSYRTPKILIVKNRETFPAILINEPEDMINILIKTIRPLPVIMASTANCRGVWGVVLQKGDLIVLFDFYKNENLKKYQG